MNAAEEYLETRVMTARPEELHMMVVEGAIRYAVQAKEAIENDDFETSHFALNRAREFVMELLSGLDEQHAPDVVKQLKDLFGFTYSNLSDADRNRNADNVIDALRILEFHRATWRELMQKLKDGPETGGPHGRRNWTT